MSFHTLSAICGLKVQGRNLPGSRQSHPGNLLYRSASGWVDDDRPL